MSNYNYLLVALFRYYCCSLSRTHVTIKKICTICTNALIVLFTSDNIMNNTYHCNLQPHFFMLMLQYRSVYYFHLKVFTTITITLLLKKTCVTNHLNRLMLSCNNLSLPFMCNCLRYRNRPPQIYKLKSRF